MRNVAVLAEHLLRNRQLDGLISGYWLTTGVIDGDRRQKLPSTREIYQTVIQNHRRWSLIRQAETGWFGPHAEQPERTSPQGEVWPLCCKLVVRLTEETLSACQRLMEVLGKDLRFHLRHYRHANLLASWLTDETREDTNAGGGSVLSQLLSEKIMVPSFEPYLRQLQETEVRETPSTPRRRIVVPGGIHPPPLQNAHVQSTAAKVLDRIVAAVAEIGYDEFVEDVTSAEFQGGPDSLVGASTINLIPGQPGASCQPLLLAVSRGDRKPIGFPDVLRQVREHLIRCPGTRSVIVLCDYWHPGILNEHLGDLRAHHDRGVRFLFLMVGTPGRLLAPVGVDLGLTP